jgi:type IV pilus assembly protein PilE
MNNRRITGFSLIELMVAMVIVGILAAVAVPSYNNYTIRSARLSAQAELINLASVEEKIFLNSNAYSPNVTTTYDGTSAGGLGVTSGKTSDEKYTVTLNITTPSQIYTLTATPITGKSQVNDGSITISENGQRLWNGVAW